MRKLFRSQGALGFFAVAGVGCAAPSAATVAPERLVASADVAAPAAEAASSETVFTCRCAIGPREDAPGDAAACRLLWRSDGTAALSGLARRANGGDAVVASDWQVVRAPVTRVEPEPFVAFRGALTLDGVAQPGGPEVWFVDNLIYLAPLDASSGPLGLALHFICNPPEG